MASVANDNLTAALQNKEYDAVAQQAHDAATGGQVLDWGCGEGQISARLVALGSSVESFDFDPEAEGPERVPFVRYPELSAIRSNDPVELPFDDGSFRAILSCGVLEHVERPLDSLLELRRVLEPGGTLLIYKLPNRTSLLEAIARVAGMPYHGMRVHDTLWGLRSTRWALEAAGFDVDWVRRANWLPLTIDHPVLNRNAARLWRINRRLAKVPGLSVLSTNVEARATKPNEVKRREIVS
jgi:SAM-dependent methyltransferase